jgi:tetratricopeptide (TPR) repeat protein
MTFYKDRKIAHSFIAVCTCFLLLANRAEAQLHTPHLPGNKQLRQAEELLAQKQYRNAVLAVDIFMQQPHSATRPISHSESDKAGYIKAISLLNLQDADAESVAISYINHTANPAYKQRTAFALAQSYFKTNRFADAIRYYELAGVANLDNEEIINAKFELAYCYFNNSQFNQAEPLLASVRELGGKYYDAGNYYYGLLAYNKNNYQDALNSFNRIENKKEYNNIVPYYIAEIHYFTGNKQKALQDALRLINRSEKSFYHNELHLLAAQVYFEDKNYSEALPYFEYYYENTERIRKEDLYEMAYCYYQLQDWEDAIDYFQQLSETRDSLGQSSTYLLGDCYLKTGDTKSARNAFSICADMPFNSGQKEASMLIAAKLSYEMGYNSDAIYYVNLLLADFPNSVHADEAKTMLSDLLIRTSNYAEAYDALTDVSKRDNNYNRIFQKVTYGYAMQQMQASNYVFADSLLNMSLAGGTDPVYKTAAYFWKADLAYRAGNYKAAINYGNRFVSSDGRKEWVAMLSPDATDRNALITMGHASMELSAFKEAQDYFSKARYNADTATDSLFIASTVLQEADAVFMQKDYNKAITLYDKVIAANTSDADYARFQKAVILGLSGNNKGKAEILSGLIGRAPASKYENDARYELGLTYIEENKYSAAINTLMPLTEAYEIRNMAPRAWMKIGFAYQQSGNEQKAIASYQRIVQEYPASEERTAALDALKSLYIQSGKAGDYATLLKENNITGTEENNLDTTYYATAEAQYAAGNWIKAKNLLDEYLQKYPNGAFAGKAHYYKAESHYQLKEYKDALSEYQQVLAAPWSNFSENSARRASAITFNMEDWQAAKKYYTELRNIAMTEENLLVAYNGLMLTNNKLNERSSASAYADTLLSITIVDSKIKENALLIKANALMMETDYDNALTLFKQLETAGIAATAAEARYNIAFIHYLQGNLKEAETAANNTIQLSAGNDYWVVKSFILLADILVQQKDYFNAKATLQSIIKNSKIPELKNQATEKLKEVKQLENKKTKLSDK